jgi:sigma-B regulation protein RsbU (phosphoserine phosphatase)
MNCLMEKTDIARSGSAQAGGRPLRILVGDDQVDVLEALRLLLKGAGHRAVTVDSPAALLRACQPDLFDLILMDLNYARDTTSGQEGLDLLTRLHALGYAPPIVVMTAWGNIELAVEAMRRGASDFVQKPWDNARLLETIHKQTQANDKSDIDLARHVQQRLFPHEPPVHDTIECFGQCVPAREVSGDYYDFLELGSGKLGLVIADVSGKGMAAALLMANLQASVRSQLELAHQGPRALLTRVNKLFHGSTLPEHYATLVFATYDDRSRRLTYVNCGHPPPVLVRAGGGVERLMPTATVLGLFPVWHCEEREVTLNSGDRLVLYSDGLTEAGIESEAEFGEERLVRLLQATPNDSAQRTVERVLDGVFHFARQQADDITVIAVRAR